MILRLSPLQGAGINGPVTVNGLTSSSVRFCRDDDGFCFNVLGLRENFGMSGPFCKIIMAAILCSGLGACASSANQKGLSAGDVEAGYDDPFESMNRGTFAFNDGLDRAVFKPVAQGYRAAVPKPVRSGVRNVLINLRGPVNAVNQLLQGDIEGFSTDTMRVLVNTTFGFGGVFDIAGAAGLEYEYEDFGQTLGVWGVGHGPYWVAPVFGPNSVRDHAGNLVDLYADPLRFYLHNIDEDGWGYARMGMTFVDKREELLDVLSDLRNSAIDYYATVRSANYQRREALLHDKNPESSAAPEIPDYDSE